MVLWPVGMAVVIVWYVFRDPAVDYRLVVAGAVLPDLVVGPFGGGRVLHTLVFSAVLLAVVMLATRHRRQPRRRWLALPIGTFLHLVLDAIWTRRQVFWWPLFGTGIPADAGRSSLTGLVAREVAGVALIAWILAAHRMLSARGVAAFARSGHLEPALA